MEQEVEIMARAAKLHDEHAEGYVVAMIECVTTALRADGDGLALDASLQAPLTFKERAPAEKVAERWKRLPISPRSR